MGQVIELRGKPFKVMNAHHNTEVTFQESSEKAVLVTIEHSQNGEHDMGIAFWMTPEQELGLFNWLLSRRILEGHGSPLAGALGSGSPLDAPREANPGSAVPGGAE